MADVFDSVENSLEYGVPQFRERLFLVRKTLMPFALFLVKKRKRKFVSR